MESTTKPMLASFSEARTRWWDSALGDIEAPDHANWRFDNDADGLFITPANPSKSCVGCNAVFLADEDWVTHTENCEKHPLGKIIIDLRKQLTKGTL